MRREIVRVCDLRLGDLISDTMQDKPYATVAKINLPNLTVARDNVEVTMHLVDYMDKVARYL